ncbi:restriction endonuclease fold toxin [Orbus wheelerorum]|uniref:restriction endonuclease fold toxin n=1 Tax=Orbus wheelerorum TaxID=3074111 RepID=UPI00370DC992
MKKLAGTIGFIGLDNLQAGTRSLLSQDTTTTYGAQFLECAGEPKGYSELVYGLFDISVITKAGYALKATNQVYNVVKVKPIATAKPRQLIKADDVSISVENITKNQQHVVELKNADDFVEIAKVTSKYSGGLIKVNKPDSAADMLALKIDGKSRVRFANDIREFDVISDLYIAQTKPALKQLNITVRKQMKATFDAALETNRSVYYHFEGTPAKVVTDKLYEYSNRYGVKVIIDTMPLK